MDRGSNISTYHFNVYPTAEHTTRVSLFAAIWRYAGVLNLCRGGAAEVPCSSLGVAS